MHITFLAPCKDLSGGIKVIATYAERLRQRGHHVTVVYPRKQISFKRKLKLQALHTLGLERDHLDHFYGDLLPVDTVTNATLPDADILIATAWETAEWAADLSASKGQKYYLIQGHEVWNAPEERVHATYRLPLRKITISSWLQRLVSKKSDDLHIPVIPNGSDFLGQKGIPTPEKRKYDLGMVYSPIPNKGSGLGLTALRILKRKYPHLKFALFGTEFPTETLPEDTVFFKKPSQKKIKSLYQQTRIWLTTSYEEGFCLPCLEAMGSGCAVISTDNKGVRDIIQDKISGFMTLPGRADELIAYSEQLLQDERLLQRIHRNAIQQAGQFSWERSTDMLEALFETQTRKMAA